MKYQVRIAIVLEVIPHVLSKNITRLWNLGPRPF